MDTGRRKTLDTWTDLFVCYSHFLVFFELYLFGCSMFILGGAIILCIQNNSLVYCL